MACELTSMSHCYPLKLQFCSEQKEDIESGLVKTCPYEQCDFMTVHATMIDTHM